MAKLKNAHDTCPPANRPSRRGSGEVLDQTDDRNLASRAAHLAEGVPGLAKTLMVSTLADCLALACNRIQFTPDLMPSDITGTEVLQQEDRSTGARTSLK